MIVITGASGMLGAHLIYTLLKSGKEVKALKRSSTDTSWVLKTISFYEKENAESLFKKIIWKDADITDSIAINDAINEGDVVYHCAAKVAFARKDTLIMESVNREGTENVVNACLQKKAKKLCHVSSIAALGLKKDGSPSDENITESPSENSGAYSLTKFDAEREVWRGIAEGLDAVIVNPSVIIGPGNWESGSPKLIKTIHSGLKFYTEGATGFVDVFDVVQIMIALTEGNYSAERFVVSSENKFYRDVFNITADALGVKRPTIKAGKKTLFTARVLSRIGTYFTGKMRAVTKDTATAALSKNEYTSQKVIVLLDFHFLPVEDSIKRTAKIFLKQLED